MTKVTRRQFIKRGILGAMVIGLLDAFWFEKYVIQWNHFDRTAEGKTPITIVQISDLHMNKLRSFHQSIARKINDIQPDLIVITGDAIEDNQYLPVLEEFLSLIALDLPKVAITGNWEYWGKVDLVAMKAIYAKYNTTLLINQHQTMTIKDRVVSIVGIDDLIGGRANYPVSVEGLPSTDTTIVLTHCPLHREAIINQRDQRPIDLVLCGHTHGGQITFLGYVPMTPRGSGRYVKGWYEDHELPTYVCKGIGTSILPIRFGARAEVAVFTI